MANLFRRLSMRRNTSTTDGQNQQPDTAGILREQQLKPSKQPVVDRTKRSQSVPNTAIISPEKVGNTISGSKKSEASRTTKGIAQRHDNNTSFLDELQGKLRRQQPQQQQPQHVQQQFQRPSIVINNNIDNQQRYLLSPSPTYTSFYSNGDVSNDDDDDIDEVTSEMIRMSEEELRKMN